MATVLDARATPPASTPTPPASTPTPARGPGQVKADIEDLVATLPADVGIAVLDEEGELVLGTAVNEPFVLASVAKVYIMAAYLDQIHAGGSRLDDNDVYLLQAMIRYSDNDSASTLWSLIGEEEGLAEFLESRRLAYITTTEDGAWGTLEASAGQVSELMWRLAYGDLLDPESTQVALSLLSDVDEDQAWGVSAGAPGFGSTVYLKNGWYPEEDGWRINSAGIVRSLTNGYVLVIMAYPAGGFDEGIDLIEDIARRVNEFMSERRPS